MARRGVLLILLCVIGVPSCDVIEDGGFDWLTLKQGAACITAEGSTDLAAALEAYGDGQTFFDYQTMCERLFGDLGPTDCDDPFWTYAIETCNGGQLIALRSGGFNGFPGSVYYDAQTGAFLAWCLFTDGGNSCNTDWVEWWPTPLALEACSEPTLCVP